MRHDGFCYVFHDFFGKIALALIALWFWEVGVIATFILAHNNADFYLDTPKIQDRAIISILGWIWHFGHRYRIWGADIKPVATNSNVTFHLPSRNCLTLRNLGLFWYRKDDFSPSLSPR